MSKVQDFTQNAITDTTVFSRAFRLLGYVLTNTTGAAITVTLKDSADTTNTVLTVRVPANDSKELSISDFKRENLPYFDGGLVRRDAATGVDGFIWGIIEGQG